MYHWSELQICVTQLTATTLGGCVCQDHDTDRDPDDQAWVRDLSKVLELESAYLGQDVWQRVFGAAGAYTRPFLLHCFRAT